MGAPDSRSDEPSGDGADPSDRPLSRISAMTFDENDLARHFGRIWPVHVQAFSALLIALRRQFGGDWDRMLVMAIIGSRTLPQRRIEGLSYNAFMAL
jgi:hypothetical protein